MVAEERDPAKLGLVGVRPGGLAEGGELDGLGPDGQLDLRARGQVLPRDRDRVAAGVQGELGLTTLFVTHDQDEALSLSDRILVMNQGAVLQAGTPEDIYRRPHTRFTAEFLGQCNILTARVAATTAQGATELVLHPGGQPITVPGVRLAAGAEVQLAVRPEAVELSALSEAPGQNAYKAEVLSVSFLGDHYLYELDIDGMPLTVTDTRSFPGPSVTVRIPPSACRVLPS